MRPLALWRLQRGELLCGELRRLRPDAVLVRRHAAGVARLRRAGGLPVLCRAVVFDLQTQPVTRLVRLHGLRRGTVLERMVQRPAGVLRPVR